MGKAIGVPILHGKPNAAEDLVFTLEAQGTCALPKSDSSDLPALAASHALAQPLPIRFVLSADSAALDFSAFGTLCRRILLRPARQQNQNLIFFRSCL
jgi:hypothetical protein